MKITRTPDLTIALDRPFLVRTPLPFPQLLQPEQYLPC